MRSRHLRDLMTLRFSRRHLLQAAATAPLTTLSGLDFATQALAQDSPPWRHGVSLFGEVKYPPDFKKFDYVNADAPKGGAVRQISIGTFDSFNLVVAGVKGQVARPSSISRVADDGRTGSARCRANTACSPKACSIRTTFSWAVYRLRAEARWHDGASR